MAFNLQDAIMQIALGKFQEELSNPNSPITKKFNETLFGNGKDDSGLLYKFASDNAPSNNVPKRSDEEIAQEMKRYTRKPGEVIRDNVLSGTGRLIKGVGNAYNAYESLLGDALLAVNGAVANNAAASGMANPLILGAVPALGRKARGAIVKEGTDTTSDILNNIATDLKYDSEKRRQTEILLRERPTGKYYDARKQMSKMQNLGGTGARGEQILGGKTGV